MAVFSCPQIGAGAVKRTPMYFFFPFDRSIKCFSFYGYGTIMGYQSEFHVCDTWLVQGKVGCILQQGCMTWHNTSMQMPHQPVKAAVFNFENILHFCPFLLFDTAIKSTVLVAEFFTKIQSIQQSSNSPSSHPWNVLFWSVAFHRKNTSWQKQGRILLHALSSTGNFHGWKSIRAVSIRDTGKNSMLANQDHNHRNNRKISSIHTQSFILIMEYRVLWI